MSENLFSAGISVLSIFITAFVGVSVRRLQAREEEKKKQREADSTRQTAIEVGLQAILRDRLLQAFEHYGNKGWVDVKAAQNMQMMYNAYHNLGGNDIVTDVYNNFRKLPHYPPKGGN